MEAQSPPVSPLQPRRTHIVKFACHGLLLTPRWQRHAFRFLTYRALIRSSVIRHGPSISLSRISNHYADGLIHS